MLSFETPGRRGKAGGDEAVYILLSRGRSHGRGYTSEELPPVRSGGLVDRPPLRLLRWMETFLGKSPPINELHRLFPGFSIRETLDRLTLVAPWCLVVLGHLLCCCVCWAVIGWAELHR